ncbi:MAG: hypothetical protein AB7N80_03795 [Bdellovibrionales bacterium]
MSWLKEDPSSEHRQAVERAVQPELDQLRADQRAERLWRWLIAAVPVGAATMALLWVRRAPWSTSDEVDAEMLSLLGDTENETIAADELEMLEDLDLFEELEELESWNS